MDNTTFSTEHFVIRPLEKGDTKRIRAINASQIALSQSLDETFSLSDAEVLVTRAEQNHADFKFGLSAVDDKLTGKLLGFCGFDIFIHEDAYHFNLHWQLKQKYNGIIVPKEVLLFFRDFAFLELNLTRFITVIDVSFKDSQQLAKSIGMSVSPELSRPHAVVFEIKQNHGAPTAYFTEKTKAGAKNRFHSPRLTPPGYVDPSSPLSR